VKQPTFKNGGHFFGLALFGYILAKGHFRIEALPNSTPTFIGLIETSLIKPNTG
jgi:hypothetical protein